MAAVFDLEERIEAAVKAVLAAASLPTGVTITAAFENTEIKEPAVLITLPSSDAPQDEQGLEFATGNRQGVLTIGIRTHSDYGIANHRTLVAAVRDLFYSTSLAGSINTAASGAAIYRLDVAGSDRAKTEGNSYLTSLQAEVWFRPVPVTP